MRSHLIKGSKRIAILFLCAGLVMNAGLPPESVQAERIVSSSYIPDEEDRQTPSLTEEAEKKEVREILSDPDPLTGSEDEIRLFGCNLCKNAVLPEAYPGTAGDPLGEKVSSYLNTLPAIRDQASYGSCWAHSVLSAVELALIRGGYADSSIDLSERHLVRYTFGKGSNPILEKQLSDGQSDDNYTYDSDSEAVFLNAGGNDRNAGEALTKGRGPVAESLAPYPSSTSERYQTTERWNGLEFVTDFQVTGYYVIRIKENPDLAKARILENGAVTAAIKADNSRFNEEHDAYYTPDFALADHAVTLVGWDDSFPVSYFGDTQPENPGAWLVRNSYGGQDLFSFNSYFWISYEDMSLLDTAYAWEAEPVGDWDNQYFYDSQFHNRGGFTETWPEANVFKIGGLKNTEQEEVKAVSFLYTLPSGGAIEAAIPAELRIVGTDINGAPDEENLLYKKELTLPYSGRYTEKLPEKAVVLSSGEKVAVILDVESGSVPLEKNAVFPSVARVSVHANPGESFYYEEGWKDMTSLEQNEAEWRTYGNFCIGLQTKDIGEAQEEKDPDSGNPSSGTDVPETEEETKEPEPEIIPDEEGKPLKKAKITVKSATFTGAERTPAVTVKYGKKTLVKDRDYMLVYKNNVSAGKGEVSVIALRKSTGVQYSGSVKKTFTIAKREIKKAKLSGVKKKVKKNPDGPTTMPDLKLTYLGKELTEGTDYRVTYSGNRKTGTAKLKIKGIGNFKGTITKKFRIVK